LEVAWVVLVEQLPNKIQINVPLFNPRWVYISEVESKLSLSVLSREWTRKGDGESIISCEIIDEGTKQFWKNEVPEEPDWILEDDHEVVDQLLHEHSDNLVLVVQISVSKVDITVLDIEHYLSCFFIQVQVCLDVELKVLEYELHVRLRWEE